jgi:hypothetical protein
MLWALLAVIVAWSLALTAYRGVQNSRMTGEKVLAYLGSTDLGRLSSAEREGALRALADRLNALTLEERRRVREDHRWKEWLAGMTDAEKETLVTATFPTGIKQMMTAFEQLSPSQRQRMVDDAIKRLRSSGELTVGADTFKRAPGQEPAGSEVSPKLAERIREIGLQAFFAESSAEMKVEAAPLLEEIQRQMQSGGWGRNHSR